MTNNRIEYALLNIGAWTAGIIHLYILDGFHASSVVPIGVTLGSLILGVLILLLNISTTARRLYAIRWPTWLALTMFLPYANFILFAVLCLVPSRLVGR